MAVLLISMAHYWLWMRCWCQPIQPMSHLREGLIAMPASHRCTSNIPPLLLLPSHPGCLIHWLVIKVKKRELRDTEMLCFHFIFTLQITDCLWLNSENPESCIITVRFLIPFAFQYPKGRCFNVYLLLFMSRERAFYSRAMECWIKWWFSCTNTERWFQEKQFPLLCLSKSSPKAAAALTKAQWSVRSILTLTRGYAKLKMHGSISPA